MSVEIFVSHKSRDEKLAGDIVTALKGYMDEVNFYLSENIKKGKDLQSDIHSTLRRCKLFILLYTDPLQDWSWCLYEAGLFCAAQDSLQSGDRNERWLYCIHFPDIPPPDALGRVQTIVSTGAGLKTWLGDFYGDTAQTRAWRSLDQAAAHIERLLNENKPIRFATSHLRPAFELYPVWPTETRPNWRVEAVPENLPLERSTIKIDDLSARELGFGDTPSEMNIGQFLKRLDTEPADRNRIWIARLLGSVQASLQGRISDQEITYFRSVRGNVLRPVVESITRADNGSKCWCRVVFVDAFSAPPPVRPCHLQMLANGARLAVRTRIEVLDRYLGKMEQELSRLRSSADPSDELACLIQRIAAIRKPQLYNALNRRIDPVSRPPHPPDRHEFRYVRTVCPQKPPAVRLSRH
jgi:TIR domain